MVIYYLKDLVEICKEGYSPIGEIERRLEINRQQATNLATNLSIKYPQLIITLEKRDGSKDFLYKEEAVRLLTQKGYKIKKQKRFVPGKIRNFDENDKYLAMIQQIRETDDKIKEVEDKIGVDKTLLDKLYNLLSTGEYRMFKVKVWVDEGYAWNIKKRLSALYRKRESLKNEFIQQHKKFVYAIAKRKSPRLRIDKDAIQEGNIGLLKALETFDFSKGCRFSTYAIWWVRHSLSRYLTDQTKAIRIPVHLHDTYCKVVKYQHQFHAKNDRLPSADETLEHFKDKKDVTLKRLNDLQRMPRVSHLNDLIDKYGDKYGDGYGNAESGTEFMALICHNDQKTSEEEAIDKDLEQKIRETLNKLPAREAKIIRERFGIDCESKSLHKVSEEIGVTRERVRQIQERILKKLRKPNYGLEVLFHTH